MSQPTSWLAHVQLLDSALPIGAFSHSFGLETLVQQGTVRTSDDLREYCRTMLFHAWAPCDALVVKAVYSYAPNGQWDELWQLDQMMHVARTASETRDGLRKIGRRLLQLGQALHPTLPWEPLLQAVESRRCTGSYPMLYGWICFHLNVPLEQATTGFLYSCLSSCINNAVRLMRIGQTQGQAILIELLPTISEAWFQMSERDPHDFSTNTPAAEIAMMEHETLYSRLFMS